jgi:hypothetical protein
MSFAEKKNMGKKLILKSLNSQRNFEIKFILHNADTVLSPFYEMFVIQIFTQEGYKEYIFLVLICKTDMLNVPYYFCAILKTHLLRYSVRLYL